MKVKNIKPGERLSMTYYLKVNRVPNDNTIEVTDQNGMNFTVQGRDLIENTIKSASQFSKTEKVSRTELVNTLINARDSVFTVNFDKTDGTNRTLVGHLLDTENTMGRSNVRDLEVSTGHPIRQVDHRTTHYLILNDTKYQVK